LDAADLARFKGREGVLGLGEMMNVPGVLAKDSDLFKKLGIFHTVTGTLLHFPEKT
jgi:adenine deaminase